MHPTMYCSHWFITIFAYALPFDHLLRVWDVFFLEGIKTVFRCGHVSCSKLFRSIQVLQSHGSTRLSWVGFLQGRAGVQRSGMQGL